MRAARALLLTDIVDSTALAEGLGDAAAAALWAAHDRVARDLLVAHGGREIDKTDGFLLLFESVDAAVAYALAYHRAIRDLEPALQARAGVHLGPVILTRNTPEDVARGAKPLEVDGLAKPTAARVMSMARAGQTLLTASAAAGLTAPLRVVSHGHWRLKGVEAPMEVFEVGDDDAPFVPPEDGAKVYRVVPSDAGGGDLWLPVREVPRVLPAERDAFVGRTDDLAALDRALRGDERLVSVLGIGGTGKTRLVVRYAWIWLGDHPGGVWFCDLGEARDLDGIVGAVARALDVALEGDAVLQLGHAIAERGRCLLVLDNFEQVSRFARDTVGRWLDGAPEARFLVTSREVLGLAGERTVVLAPLDRASGVEMFVARASSAHAGFALTEANRPHVAHLVALLDALPLAIELAAARVRVLPPERMVQHMDQRFRVLAAPGRRQDRQATLQATLDWSWDLLDADERAGLAQLSVFEGGFALDAADAVLSLPEGGWALDVVQSLVDKSLVQPADDDRFDLLVSVKAYAAGKLGEQAAAAEARHGAWFASGGPASAEDIDNLGSAVDRAAATGRTGDAVGAAHALWSVASRSAPSAPLVERLERVAGLPDVAAYDRAVLLAHASRAAHRGGGLDRAEQLCAQAEAAATGEALAFALCQRARLCTLLGDHAGSDRAAARALELARGAALVDIELECLLALAESHRLQQRSAEALEVNEEVLRRADALGDVHFRIAALGNVGLLHMVAGRLPQAEASLRAALALADQTPADRERGRLLCSLGQVLGSFGRPDEAVPTLEAAAALLGRLGDRPGLRHVHSGLARAHEAAGRWDRARFHQLQHLALAREAGLPHDVGQALVNLAADELVRGEIDAAERHLIEARGVYAEAGHHQDPVLECNLCEIALQRGAFDAARAHLELVEAALAGAPVSDFGGYVHTLRARVEQGLGRHDAARTALAAAEAVAAALGVGEASPLVREVRAARAALAGPGPRDAPGGSRR